MVASDISDDAGDCGGGGSGGWFKISSRIVKLLAIILSVYVTLKKIKITCRLSLLDPEN